jgi:hypothetical protein
MFSARVGCVSCDVRYFREYTFTFLQRKLAITDPPPPPPQSDVTKVYYTDREVCVLC